MNTESNFYFQSPSSNYFNKIWYKETYALNIPENKLLEHYCTIGYKENLNPSLYFNTKWYKETYKIPDNMNPLDHFCANNHKDYLKPNEKCRYYIRDVNFNEWTIIPKNDFILLKNEPRRINLLLPAYGLSAGPSTIHLFADFLSKKSHKVRIIFCFGSLNNINELNELKKRSNISDKVEFVSLRDNHIKISYDDIFVTSAWWTVYPLKFILGYLNFKKFFWFIQENELLLHSGDEVYAKALSCYNMEYYSFINTSILFDDLKKCLYPFIQETYCKENSICFEPAFDTKKLYYIEKPDRKNLKIIFYSRDANIAKRNCVKLVHNLIISSYQNGLLTKNDKVFGFGQKKGIVNLPGGFYYEELGFLDLNEYYQLFNDVDILISFQMAPHPSYPPLEMSFCNGLTIHTNFSNKTQETISRYTDKIIMCDPNINSLLDGIAEAIMRIKENKISNEPPKLLNSNWNIPFKKCYDLFVSKIPH
jgi:hypothetical protein